MRLSAPPISSAKADLIPTILPETQRAASLRRSFATYLAGDSGNAIWELWLAAAKTSYIVGQCIATTEPAYLAKHAFHLAQLFNTFYHQHPILAEPDEGRKTFLLVTAAVARRELIRVLQVMGITRAVLRCETWTIFACRDLSSPKISWPKSDSIKFLQSISGLLNHAAVVILPCPL